MSSQPIRIGSFEIERPVGRGGMGEVFAAVHVPQQRTVAVKLLTSKTDLEEKYRTAFRNEVRNAAQLDHPNLVGVYDYGEVTGSEAAESGGKLVERTPWFAMELVEGGTLLPHCGTFEWLRVVDVVLGLLDALAHAHARGVYHRDLKPANVLLGQGTRQGQSTVVKLSDFGLAHAVDATEEDHFSGGTPSYMAPEQFEGDWRNYGPWTDLYSLGCVLYALIRGRPPFGPSKSFHDSHRAHRELTVPALNPPFPVPAGFESWLRRLLEKDPAKRYRRAADALYDFLQLEPPENRPGLAPSIPVEQDTVRLHTLSTLMEVPGLGYEPFSFTVGSDISKPPPIPVDWRDPDIEKGARDLRVGLKLFGLRPVPFVGRMAERDALWNGLHTACREQGVHVVGLLGRSGIGKSRLAEWICQRGHEVGSGIVMRATHGPVAGARDGLTGLAQRFLRCDGLEREALSSRISGLTGEEDEHDALMELLAPGSGVVRFGSVEERHFAVRQLIVRATAERPVIMWLDDVHWGPDSLRFVRRLLAEDLQRPVLIVMTANAEAFSERRDEAGLWEEIVADERSEILEVAPLETEHRSELIEEVLGLDATIGDAVAQGTAGNPLFAVQLIGDWIERDLLELGPTGFVPRAGAGVTVPSALSAVWERRVERLLRDLDAQQVRAAELAATLGMTVNRGEWESACQILGVRADGALVDAFLHAGLARSGNDGFGWRFAHPSLPETLTQHADRSGRLRDCHAACAGLLLERLRVLSSPPRGMRERLGRHLLCAGDAESALEPLLRGVDERVNRGDYRVALELLDLHARALEDCGVPRSDPRWGQNQFPHFHIARRQGRKADTVRLLDDIESDCTRFGWAEMGVEAQILRGRLFRQQGELEVADRALKRALEKAVGVRAPRLIAEARFELGETAAYRGRLDRAHSFVSGALADYERLEDRVGQARCWQCLGELSKESGRYAEARELLRRAQGLFQMSGNRWGRASAFNSEGDAARHEGRLDEAEALYRRSGGLFRAIGSASAAYPEYNFALTQIARGQVHEARPVIERLLAHFESLQDGVGIMNAHFALAACEAEAGRWVAWDYHLGEGRELVIQMQAADEDTAWIAEVCGQRAALGGMPHRAVEAYRLALDTWMLLERGGRVAAVQQALAALEEEP